MAETEDPLKRAVTTLREVLSTDEMRTLSLAIQEQVARARHEDYANVLTDRLPESDPGGSIRLDVSTMTDEQIDAEL